MKEVYFELYGKVGHMKVVPAEKNEFRAVVFYNYEPFHSVLFKCHMDSYMLLDELIVHYIKNDLKPNWTEERILETLKDKDRSALIINDLLEGSQL